MEQVSEFLDNLAYMTFSGERFWWILLGIAVVIGCYQLLKRFVPKSVAPIGKFLARHPLIWVCIPAALVLYFVYVSLGWNLWVSVSDWESGQLEASYGWGGFGNYIRMFSSSNFWPALKNTLLLFCLIPLCLLLGLGIALLMDQGLRGTALFRTLILLPFALSFVVTGTVWAYMYRPTGGVLNSFLSILGVNVSAAMKNGSLMWASSSNTIMLSIIIAMVWQFSGYVAVIFLAAIKNVPTNIINAAKLDGAYMPRVYLKLIIPQLKGAMGSCITILAMYALRSFDFIVSLVGYTTSAAWTLPIWMYNEAFQSNNFAYSSAISCFLLALVLVLILPLTYWTNRRA
ncbi:MAG: sugar ABC transporter permease [Oscillospiraceae bacterium]|nr:sugar ABC transporter permease [Oscillospiraceae bacterium]